MKKTNTIIIAFLLTFFWNSLQVLPQTEKGNDDNVKQSIKTTKSEIDKQKKIRKIIPLLFDNMEDVTFSPTDELVNGPGYLCRKLKQTVKYDIYQYFDPSEVNTPLKKAKLVGTEEYKRIQDKLEKEKDVALSKWYFFVAKPMDHYYDLDTKRYIINDYRLSVDNLDRSQINNIIFHGLQNYCVNLNGKNDERLAKFYPYHTVHFPQNDMIAIPTTIEEASEWENTKEFYIGFKFKVDGTFSSIYLRYGAPSPVDEPNAGCLALLILKKNSDLDNDFTLLREIVINKN